MIHQIIIFAILLFMFSAVFYLACNINKHYDAKQKQKQRHNHFTDAGKKVNRNRHKHIQTRETRSTLLYKSNQNQSSNN